METKLHTIMKRYSILLMLILYSFLGKGNNVVINSVYYVPEYVEFSGLTYPAIQINFSNLNSFSVGDLKDGVYIFLKYKTPDGVWHPIPSSSFFSSFPSGYAIYQIRGGGIISSIEGIYNDVLIGLNAPLPHDIELRAFAIEMVFKSPGFIFSPYMGDGNNIFESTNAFHGTLDNLHSEGYIMSVDVNTFDDAEIEAPNDIAILPGGITNAAINNPEFPVGYSVNGFWVMKYEISQAAYRDFLNTLTLTQQQTRTTYPVTSVIGTGALSINGANRNFIEIKIPVSSGTSPVVYGCDADGDNIFDEVNDGEYIACNYLSWMDIAAYLDWAGLAPMTETQYEILCVAPTTYFGVNAWGNITLNSSPLTLINSGGSNESITNGSETLGNANYSSSGINGPLRNGIFSTATSDTRRKAGAIYYGAMEMSGNLYEPCVTIGNVAGRSFNKSQSLALSHGDGVLAANGNALENYWPGNVSSTTSETIVNGEVTTAAGTIRRGGSWNSPASELRKADRSQGEVPSTRTATQGGRGVLNL